MKKTENLRFVFSRPTLLMFVTGREAPLDQRNRKPPPPPRAQFTFRFPFLFSFSLFFFLVFSFFCPTKEHQSWVSTHRSCYTYRFCVNCIFHHGSYLVVVFFSSSSPYSVGGLNLFFFIFIWLSFRFRR